MEVDGNRIEAGANLEGADLLGANLEGANLEGAKLKFANFKGAKLWSANFKGADLESAYFEGAYLEGSGVFDLGQRSDGYQFFVHKRDDTLYILAGCRYFTIEDAWDHWKNKRQGTNLQRETFFMLERAEKLYEMYLK